MEARTLAVSAMLSFLPICDPDGSRYVVPIPRSCAATSKEQRVLVLVFSKIRATFLPGYTFVSMPFFFFCLKSAAVSSRYSISCVVKSSSLRKSRPCKLISAISSSLSSPCPAGLPIYPRLSRKPPPDHTSNGGIIYLFNYSLVCSFCLGNICHNFLE